MQSVPLLTPAATILSLGLMLCGCNAGGSGGGDGGTGNDDPLPEYQLGRGDEEFDANVAAITQADNESLECFESTVRFTEEEVLASLNAAYVNDPDLAPTFEDFVEDVAAIQTFKRDQICDTTLDEDEDLDAAIQRITDTANRLSECRGNEAAATVEDSLLTVKALFFDDYLTTLDLVVFAEQTADQQERQVEEECGEGADE